jgi:hypothetical protein
MLMLPSGAIVQVNLVTGQIVKRVYRVYYASADCAGQAYLDYRLTAPFPVKGRVVRTSDDRYFEITGFVSSVNTLSMREYMSSGQMGTCTNTATTLGNLTSGTKAAILQSVSAPESFELLAPLKLQLE